MARRAHGHDGHRRSSRSRHRQSPSTPTPLRRAASSATNTSATSNTATATRNTIRVRSPAAGLVYHLVFEGSLRRLTGRALFRHLAAISNVPVERQALFNAEGRRVRGDDDGRAIGLADGCVLTLQLPEEGPRPEQPPQGDYLPSASAPLASPHPQQGGGLDAWRRRRATSPLEGLDESPGDMSPYSATQTRTATGTAGASPPYTEEIGGGDHSGLLLHASPPHHHSPQYYQQPQGQGQRQEGANRSFFDDPAAAAAAGAGASGEERYLYPQHTPSPTPSLQPSAPNAAAAAAVAAAGYGRAGDRSGDGCPPRRYVLAPESQSSHAPRGAAGNSGMHPPHLADSSGSSAGIGNSRRRRNPNPHQDISRYPYSTDNNTENNDMTDVTSTAWGGGGGGGGATALSVLAGIPPEEEALLTADELSELVAEREYVWKMEEQRFRVEREGRRRALQQREEDLLFEARLLARRQADMARRAADARRRLAELQAAGLIPGDDGDWRGPVDGVPTVMGPAAGGYGGRITAGASSSSTGADGDSVRMSLHHALAATPLQPPGAGGRRATTPPPPQPYSRPSLPTSATAGAGDGPRGRSSGRFSTTPTPLAPHHHHAMGVGEGEEEEEQQQQQQQRPWQNATTPTRTGRGSGIHVLGTSMRGGAAATTTSGLPSPYPQQPPLSLFYSHAGDSAVEGPQGGGYGNGRAAAAQADAGVAVGGEASSHPYTKLRTDFF